jgi:MFS transporter, UMF1 family
MAPRNEPQALLRPPPAPRLFSRLSHVSKRSLRSHSSSFEADDERSTTDSIDDDDDSGSMSPPSSNGNGHGPASPPARYPGEDTRPTSQKELAGWYAYAFAAEVYVICG